MGTTLVMYSNKSPAQLVNGPGSTGKNAPISPTRPRMNPRIRKKISIFKVFDVQIIQMLQEYAFDRIVILKN